MTRGQGEQGHGIKKGSKVLEELYVIDFDRTLVDSTTLGHMYIDALGLCSGEDVTALHDKLDSSEGGSINLIAEADDVIGLDRGLKERVEEAFIATAAEVRNRPKSEKDFFEPGATELLGRIPSHKRMIFTYGTDERWQTLKLKAAGLYDQHHQITTETGEDGKPIAKPLLLAHMQRGNYFEVPSMHAGDTPLRAKKLIMIDDKYENLENLPEGVEGYLYVSMEAEAKLSDEKRQKVAKLLQDNPHIHLLRQLNSFMSQNTLY